MIKTNRIVIKQDNVAFIASIEEHWWSSTSPVGIIHKISLKKCVFNGKAKVIKLQKKQFNDL